MEKLNEQGQHGKPNRATGHEQWQQQDLISSGTPLFQTRLHSLTAPRKPYYEISIFDRPGFGYLIEKSSGAAGAKPNVEIWYRPNLKQALEKKSRLIDGKMNKKRRGRVYTFAADEEQT
jgi:hypothetical protein